MIVRIHKTSKKLLRDDHVMAMVQKGKEIEVSSLGNLTCKMLHGLESGGKATVSMALEGYPIVF